MQGKSSCQHTKILGHSFLHALKNSVNVESFIMIFAYQEKADLCTWHYDKKNAPHFFYLKLAVNFSFIQRSLKRLSAAEWNGKNSSLFQWIQCKRKREYLSSFCYGITSEFQRYDDLVLVSIWLNYNATVSNIVMSMKSPKRSIVKNGFFGYFIKQFFFEIVDGVRSQ